MLHGMIYSYYEYPPKQEKDAKCIQLFINKAFTFRKEMSIPNVKYILQTVFQNVMRRTVQQSLT